MDKIIVITGPTASGKTKLSIEVAHKYNGEIINADSTQMYRGLNIATAKIREDEKEGIVHHLMDICDLDEEFTVFDFQEKGRRIIADILSRKKTVIVVGGTGLYIKALLYDYQFETLDNSETYSEYSDEEVYKMLLKYDPDTDIDPHNRVRAVKALNYCIQNDKPYSKKEKNSKLLYDSLFIGLNSERNILYDRINKRVGEMLKDGLEYEARQLYDNNICSRAVMTPIGYKEFFEYFDNRISYNDAVELIKKRSRNYAKRQLTWFNNQMNIKWFETNVDNFALTVKEVCDYIENEL